MNFSNKISLSFYWLSSILGELKLRLQKATNNSNINKFTRDQIVDLADIARDVTQIVFAALVIDGLSQEEVQLSLKMVMGAAISVIFWLTGHKLSAILES